MLPSTSRLTAQTILCCLAVLVSACGDEGKGGHDKGRDTDAPAGPDESECSDWFLDVDGDGYGDTKAKPVWSCEPVNYHVDNALDCDDLDPTVSPGLPEVCDDENIDEDCDGLADNLDPDATGQTIEAWPDADLDGHGDPTQATVLVCDEGAGSGSSLLADDCDDTRANAYPGASELFGDYLDQDCDGEDLWKLEDGFELGTPDPAVFASISGNFDIVTDFVATGTYALKLMGGGAEFVTESVDATACGGLQWSFMGKRGDSDPPDPNELLELQYDDGTTWITIDRWEGISVTDASFAPRNGVISDPGAFHAALRFRLLRSGGSTDIDSFRVDDLRLECGGADTDLDGVAERYDCDPASGSHWSDCGLCVDGDGDGYGDACDIGPDCDDADATVYPGQPDPLDGIDNDCDGADGPRRMDTFESGALDPLFWDTTAASGNWTVSGEQVARGAYSLNVMGTGGTLVTQPLDTTACVDDVQWAWLGKRQGPDAGEDVVLEYETSAGWVVADTWLGDSSTDPSFEPRGGVISDPAVKWASLRLRLTWSATLSSDEFFIDDIAFGCPADGDGDGVLTDCDDSDAAHWSDCGLCTDADGDDYGEGCDLGSDCDDTNGTVHPSAGDVYGDLLDADCSGIDGVGFYDGFELGAPAAGVFPSVVGDAAVGTSYVGAGAYALRLGGGSEATTEALDTSTCAALGWSYLGKRGPDAPESTEALWLEAWDGVSWTTLDSFTGSGSTDATFSQRMGSVDPALVGGSLVFRLAADGTTTDDWFVDDFTMVCGADDDNDGVIEQFDCDPTSGHHWSDCGACVDADLDGYGTGCDLGGDCDDADLSVNPGAADPYGDTVDTDCSHSDGPGLFDDFEAGYLPNVWGFQDMGVTYGTTYVFSGTTALMLEGGSYAETVPVDLSSCPAVLWTFQGKRGPDLPDAGDFLTVSYDDGVGWVEVDAWEGGATDPTFSQRWGLITDPAARQPGFRLRLDALGLTSDDFHVDDLQIGCSDDVDGDQVPVGLDCDDANPNHWSDCGICADADGDQYGAGCDLGEDCDDSSAAIVPGAADPVDGIDQDCNMLDGPGLYDDFEASVPNPTTWASVTGDAAVVTEEASSGSYSLKLGGGIGTAETVAFDASGCSTLIWSYKGKRGPEQPDATDILTLSWFDGASWVVADVWNGNGTVDPTFSTRVGVITDPLAFAPTFKVRIESDGSGVGSDEFFVDDFAAGCSEDDGDGDGFLGAFDCDDTDPWHWDDCGVCQDLDGDGFGAGCDFGSDCDDIDPTAHPGAVDPYGDGMDTDCSLTDGPGLFDDFEAGYLPRVWGFQDTGVTYGTTYVFSGTTALALEGGSFAETVPVDLSSCPAVLWTYQGKRGPDAPETVDFLTVSYDDGVGWIEVDAWQGGVTDPIFSRRWGMITDPTALWPGFRLRLEALGTTTDDFHVDDLQVGCSPGDVDGDGFPVGIDCDDADPAHWSDCGICVDGDDDEYGAGCDLGEDCDDANDAVNPAANDLALDSVDEDCDGLDLVGLEDDFETGSYSANVWASVTGDYSLDAVDGSWALRLGGGVGVAESTTWDTTACTTIGWSYEGRRGPEQPDATDSLTLEYDVGAGWVVADTWVGGALDPAWVPRSGSIVDAAAYSPAFRVRLSTVGSGAGFDNYFLDAFRVGCVD